MDVSATLRIDSKAAIGAISKGAISERRRVRAAGRTWLNYCRNELNLKRKNINIEHVAAHKGNTLPEQIGNAAADELANRVRLSGEKQQPCPYFTRSEEPFILKLKDNLIQGDPRPILKRLEKEILAEMCP